MHWAKLNQQNRGIATKSGAALRERFSALFSLILILSAVTRPSCSWQSAVLFCSIYMVAGGLNFLMLQLMSKAMQRGPNGIIWAIIQSALVFPFLGGILFFGVELTLPRAGGIVALLAALIFFGMGKDNRKRGGSWRYLAFICLGIAAVQQNLMTLPFYYEEAKGIPSIIRAFSTGLGAFASAVIYNLLQMTPERKEQLRSNIGNPVLWKYICALQFFGLIFAYTLLYPGMNAMADAGMGGMCYPMMVGSCIVAFTLSSIFFRKERIRPLQITALTICILGLILICIPA